MLHLIVFVALFTLTAAAVQTGSWDRLLGQALLDALDANHLSVKVAADAMGLDESNLRKQLRGEPGHELRIVRIQRLPFPVYADFWTRALYLRGQQSVNELMESVDVRRRA
jgi:hypothetical protein